MSGRVWSRIVNRKGDYWGTIIKHLANAWGNRMIYFDVSEITSIRDIQHIVDGLSDGNITIIPVVTLSSPANYLTLIQNLGYFQSGVCVRIGTSSFDPTRINAFIDRIIRLYGITENQIDLVFDFEYINSPNFVAVANTALHGLYGNLTNNSLFRKIIIASGSFPPDVSFIPDGTIRSLDRIEWTLWNTITRSLKRRNLVYSDYGNVHPIIIPALAGFEGSCTIKYTNDSYFYIFRGKRASKHPRGTEQYRDESRALIRHAYYDGVAFSWGDNNINECAIGNGTPGSPRTWVRTTLNHHFTKMVDLLP
jgi:hypothetical protein